MPLSSASWQPGASLEVLRRRAALLGEIRTFFAERGVLEVETPILSSATIPDPAIESFTSEWRPAGAQQGERLYLQTSPEFAMKRLLAAGSGPIYQLARVFRQGELGRRHNPEFTLLEWYRPGFDHFALMDEVAALVSRLAGAMAGITLDVGRISYREAFLRHVGIDPFTASYEALRECAETRVEGYRAEGDESRDFWLHLLLSHLVEPHLGADQAEFLYHYPASQAALARLTDDTPPLAARFELYWRGVELCNGFHELCDAAEQRRRFEVEQAEREACGLEPVGLDEHLLAALAAGMPESAGVALGVDRLLMLLCGETAIERVMAFDLTRA